MGIETPAEFRAMLREYATAKHAPAAPDRIKQLEREMVGRRNDGLDFFPTPAGAAQEMIDAAEIKEGMTIFEPSAGMGHIAEQISLAIKKAISYANSNGLDGVVFATGQQNADLYDLSKQIDSIRYIKIDGLYDLKAVAKDGRIVIDEAEIPASRVEEIVGKDMLRKIDEGAGSKFRGDIKELRGLDIKVGGEGMKSFYDKIVPDIPMRHR